MAAPDFIRRGESADDGGAASAKETSTRRYEWRLSLTKTNMTPGLYGEISVREREGPRNNQNKAQSSHKTKMQRKSQNARVYRPLRTEAQLLAGRPVTDKVDAIL
ncbi:hypothetical protein EVAR_35799_1 [Eumeta japonica]|uniref:Uncharacterized protein n=1 Tax=Eumeta variegata TaxID=151549 RepID=A0A4C1WQJ5_EUMVA|nr:hypothetical protein EVAR_35799_1 [Eumeta japonica]